MKQWQRLQNNMASGHLHSIKNCTCGSQIIRCLCFIAQIHYRFINQSSISPTRSWFSSWSISLLCVSMAVSGSWTIHLVTFIRIGWLSKSVSYIDLKVWVFLLRNESLVEWQCLPSTLICCITNAAQMANCRLIAFFPFFDSSTFHFEIYELDETWEMSKKRYHCHIRFRYTLNRKRTLAARLRPLFGCQTFHYSALRADLEISGGAGTVYHACKR